MHGRHVFCTRALFTWKLDPTNVSRMAGHANCRTTLGMYVGTTAGILDRARTATGHVPEASARARTGLDGAFAAARARPQMQPQPRMCNGCAKDGRLRPRGAGQEEEKG